MDGPAFDRRHSPHLANCLPSARREGGTEMDAKPEVHSDLKTKMVVSGLNFYYGDTPASEGGYAAFLRQSSHGSHRSIRLREIDVVARDELDV